MAAKKWIVRISWWRGENAKPRKNQTVKTRLLKGKTLEELAGKIAKARWKSWEMLDSGGRQNPGNYYGAQLETKIRELMKSEKDVLIEQILTLLQIDAAEAGMDVLSSGLSKVPVNALTALKDSIGRQIDKRKVDVKHGELNG